MSDEPRKVDIPLQLQGVLHLSVTPIGSSTVESAEGIREGLEFKLKIKGSCERIPDQTPCGISLTREINQPDPKPISGRNPNPRGDYPGVMTVSGSSFEVETVLDIVKDELVGKGTLFCSVEPELDGAKTEGAASVEFDNQVTFEITPDLPGVMGELCTFTPAATGAFEAAEIRLTIEEYDDPDSGEGKGDYAARDLRFDLEWPADNRDTKNWRMGCEETRPATDDEPAHVTLAYPEPNEIPPFEFAHLIQVKVGSEWVQIYEPFTFAPTVDKPALTKFEIRHVADRPGENELEVRLAANGFARDVAFDIHIDTRRAVFPDGAEPNIELPEAHAISALFHPGIGTNNFRTAIKTDDVTNWFAVLSFPGGGGSTPGLAPGAVFQWTGFAKDLYGYSESVDGADVARLLVHADEGGPDTKGLCSKEALAFDALFRPKSVEWMVIDATDGFRLFAQSSQGAGAGQTLRPGDRMTEAFGATRVDGVAYSRDGKFIEVECKGTGTKGWAHDAWALMGEGLGFCRTDTGADTLSIWSHEQTEDKPPRTAVAAGGQRIKGLANGTCAAVIREGDPGTYYGRSGKWIEVRYKRSGDTGIGWIHDGWVQRIG